MYQQHEQFEEALHDGPQPETNIPYSGYPEQEPASSIRSEPPFQSYQYEAGQKLLVHVPQARKSARLGLTILSILSVLVLFSTAFFHLDPMSILVTTIVFAFITLLINFVFNRR